MQKFASLLLVSFLFSAQFSSAQDTATTKNLQDVIVTGQYKPQSLKNSVYSVRVISAARIALSGATNVQQVLNTTLGFRFSNDKTLGATDVQVNSMSGRNVKILLDGVPVLDRFDQRVSLSQIDISTIERIEIVEGPMSVSYGSDAMAGVINIITKKNMAYRMSLSASAQEETAGDEYYPFSYKGVHVQHVNAAFTKNKVSFSVGGSHNEFDGFGGDDYGRGKSWLPKEQWLGNMRVGYAVKGLDLYYRLDGMKEMIIDRNTINIDADVRLATALDQQFRTDRFMHQLQGNIVLGRKASLSSMAAFTVFRRKTDTEYKDFITQTATPGTLEGQQDLSKLHSFSFKNILQYSVSEKLTLQPGLDINSEKASGARITGEPSINDVAFFISGEIKPTSKINIRPGFRFEKNSKYDAPPVIPSLNTKFALGKDLDLRLSYGYGFRAPALRELFFIFKDVNHDIVGNPDLKAETSNSFNGSLTYNYTINSAVKTQSVLGGYYNKYKNQIDLIQVGTTTRYSYFNTDQTKTAGINLQNNFAYKALQLNVGTAYYAIDKEYDPSIYRDVNKNYFTTPEVNLEAIYNLKKINTSFNLFYKYIGSKPAYSYETIGSKTGLFVTETGSYNLADFTTTTKLCKLFTLSAGVKNIFNITDVNSTTITSSNESHSTSGALAVNYGRSYFLGLALQFNKK